MKGGNLAIKDHARSGKALLLFEEQEAKVVFLGEAIYLDHHAEQRYDKERALRSVIVFHLALTDTASASQAPLEKSADSRASHLQELRRQAIAGARSSSDKREILSNVRARSVAIRDYALLRAEGQCEGCKQPAPFAGKGRKGPYLEVHHVTRLADDGPDHPDKVIALCPNCHRRAHYSSDAHEFNHGLRAWLAVKEGAKR